MIKRIAFVFLAVIGIGASAHAQTNPLTASQALVNSTIVQNGNGGITGKSLNTAISSFYPIFTAMGTFSSSGVYTVGGSGAALTGLTAPQIGFTQSGTGAVARAVQNKLADVVDTRDYGAACNLTSNDQPALQLAINFAALVNAKLHIQPGECLINSGLTVSQPIIFEGSGAGVGAGPTSNTQASQLVANFAGGDVITATSYYGAVFRDFQMVSNVGPRTSGAFIHFAPSIATVSGYEVKNVGFIGGYVDIQCTLCAGVGSIRNTFHETYRNVAIFCEDTPSTEGGCSDVGYNFLFGANYPSIPTTAGSGYTNGTYTNVAFTGGTGTGFTANVTVSGGVVTYIYPKTLGSGYAYNDVLSVAAASVGGTGSGFTYNVGLAPVQQAGIVMGTGYTNLHDNLILGSIYGIRALFNNYPAGHPTILHNVLENQNVISIGIANGTQGGVGVLADTIEIAGNEYKCSNLTCATMIANVLVSPNASGSGVPWLLGLDIHDEFPRDSFNGATPGVYYNIGSGLGVSIHDINIIHSNGDNGYDVYFQGTEAQRVLVSNIRDSLEGTWTGPKYTNIYSGVQIFDLQGIAFASMPSAIGNGSQIYVPDGTAGSPLTGAGTGSMAFRLNGAWKGF